MCENKKVEGKEDEIESAEEQREIVAETYRNGRIKLPIVVKNKGDVYKSERDPTRDDWVEVESVEDAVKRALVQEHEKYGHQQRKIEYIKADPVVCPLCNEEE